MLSWLCWWPLSHTCHKHHYFVAVWIFWHDLCLWFKIFPVFNKCLHITPVKIQNSTSILLAGYPGVISMTFLCLLLLRQEGEKYSFNLLLSWLKLTLWCLSNFTKITNSFYTTLWINSWWCQLLGLVFGPHAVDHVKSRGYDLILLILTKVKNWKYGFYLINSLVFLGWLMVTCQTKKLYYQAILMLLSAMEEEMG